MARSRRLNGKCEFSDRLLRCFAGDVFVIGTDLAHRRAIGLQQIGYELFGPAVPFHKFLEEFHRCLLVPRLGHGGLQDLVLKVDGPPEMWRSPVIFTNKVQVPAPFGTGTQARDPLASDLCREHRVKRAPPEADRFVTDFDAALMKQILDVAQVQREAHV